MHVCVHVYICVLIILVAQPHAGAACRTSWPCTAYTALPARRLFAPPPALSRTVPKAQAGATMDSHEQIVGLKERLVAAVKTFKMVQERDGSVSVDFGVKGGELDGDTRAPRNLASAGAYYGVSEDLGKAADAVTGFINELAALNPTSFPTEHFNSAAGVECPLHGSWCLLFTTAGLFLLLSLPLSVSVSVFFSFFLPLSLFLIITHHTGLVVRRFAHRLAFECLNARATHTFAPIHLQRAKCTRICTLLKCLLRA